MVLPKDGDRYFHSTFTYASFSILTYKKSLMSAIFQA